MDGGGRRSPRLTASGEESVERVPKRNNRSVSPPPPAQTGVKARPRREPVKSGKGASQGTVVGPALAIGYKLHIELHTGVKGIGRSGTSDRDGRPQTLS